MLHFTYFLVAGYFILKHFKKTQHLLQCHFLPVDQIITVIDNKMDKSDQYTKFKTFWLKVAVMSRTF